MFTWLIIICLLLFLAAPSITSAGAAAGLAAWYQTILPILFPYMVFTTILIQTSAAERIASRFYPLFHRIFSVSIHGTYAILCGFLCGYPMGAAITGQLHEQNRLSDSEASYLLSFVNLPGPSFLVGFLLHSCYPDQPLPTWCVLCTFYLCTWIISLFTRRYYPISAHTGMPLSVPKEPISIVQALDAGLSNAISTQLKICSCMVFYSALTALFLQGLELLHDYIPDLLRYLFGGIPEITSGIKRLSEYSQTPISFSIACGLCACGGISVAAQTSAVISTASTASPSTDHAFHNRSDCRTKARQPLRGYLACKLMYGILVFGVIYSLCTLTR